MVLVAFSKAYANAGFIEELRHRNVFRVGVAYVVTGWLIVQVADVAADALNAPGWFKQMLIIVLLVGLSAALSAPPPLLITKQKSGVRWLPKSNDSLVLET